MLPGQGPRYRHPHERHRPEHHRDRASDQLAGCRRLTFPSPATGNGPSVVPWPLLARPDDCTVPFFGA
ncbi:hypothetical protein GCM10009730_45610 [Streptomyces albidochromogenes]